GQTLFDEYSKCCTLVVVVVARNAETLDMKSPAELESMHYNAALVNASRVDIVNEVTLLEILMKEWISGAAVDVFVKE
ncbi:hypothetical protein K504DRAFT_341788, partial [Pleomassaria siparia CBS 279.74]